MERKLPIGIQDFVSIRQEGYVYVDKTAGIHKLITGSGKVFFLSRPRRFGKSLLCSTLRALFEERRELFRAIAGQPALAIDGLDWEWKKYPVIHLDLNPVNYTEGVNTLKTALRNILFNSAANTGLALRGELLPNQLDNLIQDMCRVFGQKTVVIIDEYDKPLLTTIDRPDVHREIKEELKAFYGVLKSSDAYLQLVFLTGITKFSQVSMFSDLNNIVDISMNPRFSDLCGITQEELERDFADEIALVCEEKGMNRQSYLAEVKRFYNGYRFSEKPETVYNPFGLLNHFNEQGKFNVYWFATGTPTFLITLIEKQKIDILKLEQKTIAFLSFQKFTADTLDALAVLYQSGYLTIVDYDDEFGIYTLDYPNEEVRVSFAEALLEHYVQVSAMDINALAVSLPVSCAKGDIERVMQSLKSFFASIPYDIQLKDEKYYQTMVHLIFRMLGLRCRSEVRIAAGRIDTLVETKGYVYCFEFKLSGTAEDALEQIDRKEYLLPWQGSGKRLVKVGVSFDHEKRIISSWKAVMV
ncbi:MAG: ATP-binding protein [Treponema sp.]|jgi:hypothetical protein|nr:ATP-binding protein [Treponema sp.]